MKDVTSGRPYAFVSYAHKDASRVLPLLEGLERRGFALWYDAGIEPGTEWPDYIAERLEGCACFLSFLSSAAASSENCRQEIDYAIDLGLPMLVIHLEDTELKGGLRMRLGRKQAMYRSRHSTDQAFLDELARARVLSACREGGAAEPAAAEKAAAPKPASGAARAADPCEDFLISDGELVKYRGQGGDVTVPEGVKTIGMRAFAYSNLTSIRLPESLRFISPYAFQGCNRLRSITVPKGVWGIGHCAFEHCDFLSEAYLPRGTEMGGEAFPFATNVYRY